MPAPLELLPKFAPVVARHFAAYLDLFADDAAELGAHVAKRMIATLVALLALSFTIAMACVWILSAAWDTPWRQIAIASLFVVFAAATVAAWFTAVRRPEVDWSPFNRLRAEWTLDEQLIAELMAGKDEEGHEEAASDARTATTSSRASRRTVDDSVSNPVKDYAT